MLEYDSVEEKACLTGLKSGREDAFLKIYEKYSLYLYRSILNLVKLREDAEEIHQDVFVRLWKYRKNIDTEQPILGYIIGIAKNEVVNYYRKISRDKERQQKILDNQNWCANIVEEDVLGKEMQAILDEIITQLPPKRQKIYRYVKMDNHTYEDAAEYFRVSLGTVKDHMAKSAKFMRKKLEKYYSRT